MLLLAAGATCGARVGADLDLRWQSCAGTVTLTLEPGIEAGEVVERARVDCDGIELAEAFCASGRLGLEYHTLPEGRLGIIVLCDGKPLLSVDGQP
jgi:hypothetical protein